MRPWRSPATLGPGGERQPLRVQLTAALVGVILMAMLPLAAVVPQIARAQAESDSPGRGTAIHSSLPLSRAANAAGSDLSTADAPAR